MPAVCVGGGRGGCQIRVALSCLLGMVYALEPSCQELWNATESNGRSSFFRQWRGEFHLAPNFPLKNVSEQKEWNAGRLLFIE